LTTAHAIQASDARVIVIKQPEQRRAANTDRSTVRGRGVAVAFAEALDGGTDVIILAAIPVLAFAGEHHACASGVPLAFPGERARTIHRWPSPSPQLPSCRPDVSSGASHPGGSTSQHVPSNGWGQAVLCGFGECRYNALLPVSGSSITQH